MAGPSSPRQSRPPLAQLRDSVTGQDNYDSFISTTSSTTSTSESVLLSSAPTPFNTYTSPQAFDTVTRRSETQEYLYDANDGNVSLQPSLGRASTVASTISVPPSFQSSHPSMNLLPTSSHLSSVPSPIPTSRKPVPAPPLSLRPSDRSIPDVLTPQTTSALFTPVTPPTTATTFSDPIGSKSGASSDVEIISSVSAGYQGKSQAEVDAQRLRQLGYDGVLGRDYTFWSSLSISTINIGCLQGALYSITGTYNYGGPLMILVAWPISGIFSIFLTLTLSELASAYPVSGAMASWAWKAARGGVGHERAWGWLMGGFVLGGHVGNVLLVTWEISKIVSGTMTIAFNYTEIGWHLVLIFAAVLAVCGVTGATAWGRSHRFWLAAGAFFCCVWLILNGSLLAGIAKNSGRGISTQFWNSTGWPSRGYVGLIGWQYCTIATGMDASAHMAEETRNPSRNVPNAMVGSMIITYVAGYISIILLLLAVDPADAATISNHSFAAGHILEAATSKSGAIGISCLLILVLTVQVLAQLQATSRFVFSLARDNAMPLSKTIQWTNSSKQPVVAHLIVIAVCLPFAAITLTGTGTLYSVLAVTGGSLSYLAYVVPVALYLLSKRDLQTEGRASWSMRRMSKPFGFIGVIFGVAVVIVQMLPGHRPVTAVNMSWSSVSIIGTAVICLITWKLYGSKHYSGPIRALTKWEAGVEIDLQSTLATSRSRPTGHVETQDETGLTRRRPSESSLKTDTFPGFGDVVHTVTVGSARTLEMEDLTPQWEDESSMGYLDVQRYRPHGYDRGEMGSQEHERSVDSGGTVRGGRH